MLRCMALVQPRWFPMATPTGKAVLDKAAAALRERRLFRGIVASIVDPARSGAIADCRRPTARPKSPIALGETAWMTRYSTFAWYSLAGEVERRLRASP